MFWFKILKFINNFFPSSHLKLWDTRDEDKLIIFLFFFISKTVNLLTTSRKLQKLEGLNKLKLYFNLIIISANFSIYNILRYQQISPIILRYYQISFDILRYLQTPSYIHRHPLLSMPYPKCCWNSGRSHSYCVYNFS